MALTKIPASLLDTSSGLDLSGNITLGANEEIQFGGASELKIFNDGTNSVLRSSDNLLIQRNTTPRSAITITDSTGEVALAYGGSTVFQTSSAGATVTGTLTVTGDLDITGNINSYNVTDLDVTDQTITLGAGQTEANSGGSGIIIDGSNASILWDETNDEWDFNKDIAITNGRPVVRLTDSTDSPSSYTDIVYNVGTASIQVDAGNLLANSAFQVSIDGTNYLKIDSSGNAVIGSTFTRTSGAGGTSTASLSVEGVSSGAAIDLVNTTTTTGRAMRMVSLNTGGLAIEDLDNSGAQVLKIDSSGNVGFNGITTFTGGSSALNTGISAEEVCVFSGNNAANGGLRLYRASTTPKFGGIQSLGYISGLVFNTNNAGTQNDVMWIDDTGDVGIGTLPSFPLHLKRTGIAELEIEGSVAAELNLYDTGGGTADQRRSRLTQNGGLFSLQGLTDDDQEVTHDFITMENSTGHVGIGKTDPSGMLHVEQTDSVSPDVPTVYITGYNPGATQGNRASIQFNADYTQKFEIGMGDNMAGGGRDFTIQEVSTGSSTDIGRPAYIFNGNGDGAFTITGSTVASGTKVYLNGGGDSYLMGGKLSIGRTSAIADLHVVDSGNGAAILCEGGNVEYYKDSTPTYAWATGMRVPGGSQTNDYKISGYDGTWDQHMNIDVATGAVTLGAGAVNETNKVITTGGSLTLQAADANHRIIIRGTQDASGAITGNVNSIDFYEYGGYNFYSGVAVGSSVRYHAMQIDDEGAVIKSRTPSFIAYRGSNYSGYNATHIGDHVILYNNTARNIYSAFNTTTGKFTAPFDGWYLFSASVYANESTVGFQQAWFVINGSRADHTDSVYQAGSNAKIITWHAPMYLSTNDAVGAHAYNSSESNVTIYANQYHTWFKGIYLG